MAWTRPKGSKYGAIRTEYNGRTYASRAEAKRAFELDLLKQAGLIREWTPQPRFTLGVPENVFVGDFHVVDRDGSEWVEDVKGFEPPKFKLVRRWWKAYGTMPLHILKGKKVEILTPNPKPEN